MTDKPRPHIVAGQFQSDKYPTCPPGKVPLSVTDPAAQPLLWEYAQRRRAVDAEFADDLEFALLEAGYDRSKRPCRKCGQRRDQHHGDGWIWMSDGPGHYFDELLGAAPNEFDAQLRASMARAVRWAAREAWIEPDQTEKYHDVMALADRIESGEVEVPR